MSNPVSTEISRVTDALSPVAAAGVGCGRPRLPPPVAVETFRRLHQSGEQGAFDSALLLCTDWRWHSVSANVISGIVDSDILDESRPGPARRRAAVAEAAALTGTPCGGSARPPSNTNLDSPGPGRTVRLDPNTPTTAHRQVWPPVRTWAASRVLKRHRASADDVIEYARSSPARDAAAVVTGAVRAVDDLDPDQARSVLNAALTWGHKAPRKAALERLLVRRGRSSPDVDAQRSRRIHSTVGRQTAQSTRRAAFRLTRPAGGAGGGSCPLSNPVQAVRAPLWCHFTQSRRTRARCLAPTSSYYDTSMGTELL